MKTTRVPLVLLAGAISIVTGCGGSSPSEPSSGGATTPTITIVGSNGRQAFTPNPASLGGQMVVFRNSDSVVHRVVLNDGSIDTGDIAPGATSRAFMIPADGTNYHCSLHASMIGSVGASTGAPPPVCTGAYC